MTKLRAIGFLAPITLGTALVGISYLVRGEDEEPFRRWSEEAPQSEEARAELSQVARQAVEEQRVPNQILARLDVPLDVAENSAPAITLVRQPPAPSSARARAQASASDTALAAGGLAELFTQLEPMTPLLPPELHTYPPRQSASASLVQPQLPEPNFNLAEPFFDARDIAEADIATAIFIERAPSDVPVQTAPNLAAFAAEDAADDPFDNAVAIALPSLPELSASEVTANASANISASETGLASIAEPFAQAIAQAKPLIAPPDEAAEQPAPQLFTGAPEQQLAKQVTEHVAEQSMAEFVDLRPVTSLTQQPVPSAPPIDAPLTEQAITRTAQVPAPQLAALDAPSPLPALQTPDPQTAAPAAEAESAALTETTVASTLAPEVLSALPFVSDQLTPQAESLPIAESSTETRAPEETSDRSASLSLSSMSAQRSSQRSRLAAAQGQGISSSSARQVFPASADAPSLSYDDELILQIRVAGFTATDTIIAYGTREGIFLPFGELSRILDLAIRVSDDGNYASGWFLSEDRTLTIDLRQQILTINEEEQPLPAGMAQAFDGDMFLRSEAFAILLPIEIEPNLRTQAIRLTTLELFPFEERMRRDAERARLNSRQTRPEDEDWPREETPWLAASVPIADIELRAVSDPAMGERLEGDLRLAGDLAFMTAQGFFSITTRDGLVSSLVELGRRDADGDLLGPLNATQFQIGDVATTSMPLGLRGTSGRGAYVTNQPFESTSVFDKIDLRGVLSDGYEVELYRNDVLLGSTRETVNGQYEFLQIPVDYGLNIFRLVFYGPQGQRREEVRRISVGDGRLSPGDFQYSLGAVQRGVNMLGTVGPDFRPQDRYGNWQAVGEVSYGFSNAITGVFSGAAFEEDNRQRWITSAGLRTGIGGLAVRGDIALSEGGGHALGVGLGGRAIGGAFTLSHFEYGGNFLDEGRGIGSEALRRATELDFNTSLSIGGTDDGTYLPLTTRVRHVEFQDGRTRLNANLRASGRLPRMIISNTIEYLRTTSSGGAGFSQLIGNFDLATFNHSSAQFRGSLGYRLSPNPNITQVAVEVSRTIDDRTVVRGSSAYSFDSNDWSLGLSAIREFERFTVALDGQYSVGRESYSVALRIGFSLGRDPLRQQVFMAQPGQAVSGAASLRAFQDMDGDGLFGPGDTPLPDVNFAVFNNTATTDENGMARLGELGHGNRITIQAEPSSLPDILMAPVNRGIEIVPRAGRFHVTDYPIVALSEVEGTVSFAEDNNQRGVSGLRLQMRNEAGEVENFVRTERGGYFFFEQVKPGTYELMIDPDQATRLGICLAAADAIIVGPIGDIISREFDVLSCPDRAAD